jgi:ABC transport system ATP-binding/permease protein
LTSTSELRQKFETARLTYANKAVSDAVKNVAVPERIIEYNGNLIQKIFPIYMTETKPSHFFDYSANLFQPVKYFAGRYFDTLYFNIAVIWSMTVVLFITLYFDVLKKAIALLAGNRKHRKKDKI